MAKVRKWLKSKQKGYNICPDCGQAFGETLRDLEKYKAHWVREHEKTMRKLKNQVV